MLPLEDPLILQLLASSSGQPVHGNRASFSADALSHTRRAAEQRRRLPELEEDPEVIAVFSKLINTVRIGCREGAAPDEAKRQRTAGSKEQNARKSAHKQR